MTSTRRPLTAVLGVSKYTVTTLVTIAVVLTGCAAGGRAADSGRTEVTVLAAASLTESFQAIGADFESQHPGVRISFSFGSSSTLATQIVNGAPADVYASADERTMRTVVDAQMADDAPQVFATNTLRIAVPAGNPGRITELADLADPERTIALCAAQVPCGAAAERLFATAGITPAPDSYERDVKAALRKTEQGEVDAALVYATDIVAADDRVAEVPIRGVDQVPNRYPIVRMAESEAPDAAEAFVDHVSSDSARQRLQDAGFGTP
jgi:molybdate transport system substrate-binding protein